MSQRKTRSDCRPDHSIAELWERIERRLEPTESGCLRWPGRTLARRGYGMTDAKRDGRWVALYVHRIAWEAFNGAIPEGLMVDHRCHNRACANIDHLRLVTPKQNMENRKGSAASSGVRGVHLTKSTGRWRAQIGHHGKGIHVGYFDDLREAEAAVIAARLRYYTFSDGR